MFNFMKNRIKKMKKRGWSVGKDLETFIGRIENRELCLLDKEERRIIGEKYD